MTNKNKTFQMMFVIDTSITLPTNVIESLTDKELFDILYKEAVQEARSKLSEDHVTTWYEVDE